MPDANCPLSLASKPALEESKRGFYMAQFQLNESLIILNLPDKFPIPHPQVIGLPTLSAIVISNVALQFTLVSKSSELPINSFAPESNSHVL